jgi:hypothetical protein
MNVRVKVLCIIVTRAPIPGEFSSTIAQVSSIASNDLTKLIAQSREGGELAFLIIISMLTNSKREKRRKTSVDNHVRSLSLSFLVTALLKPNSLSHHDKCPYRTGRPREHKPLPNATTATSPKT